MLPVISSFVWCCSQAIHLIVFFIILTLALILTLILALIFLVFSLVSSRSDAPIVLLLVLLLLFVLLFVGVAIPALLLLQLSLSFSLHNPPNGLLCCIHRCLSNCLLHHDTSCNAWYFTHPCSFCLRSSSWSYWLA